MPWRSVVSSAEHFCANDGGVIPLSWRCVVLLEGPGFSVWGPPSRASATFFYHHFSNVRDIQTVRRTRGLLAEEMSVQQSAGMRKNGKQWHEPKKAFRPAAGQTAYAKRVAKEAQAAEVKKIEKEMKAEKEEERQVSFRGICRCIIVLMGFYRGAYRASRTSERPRKRRSATRRWPRRCTRSAWRD